MAKIMISPDSDGCDIEPDFEHLKGSGPMSGLPLSGVSHVVIIEN